MFNAIILTGTPPQPVIPVVGTLVAIDIDTEVSEVHRHPAVVPLPVIPPQPVIPEAHVR